VKRVTCAHFEGSLALSMFISLWICAISEMIYWLCSCCHAIFTGVFVGVLSDLIHRFFVTFSFLRYFYYRIVDLLLLIWNKQQRTQKKQRKQQCAVNMKHDDPSKRLSCAWCPWNLAQAYPHLSPAKPSLLNDIWVYEKIMNLGVRPAIWFSRFILQSKEIR
jgi:hypothetical protein